MRKLLPLSLALLLSLSALSQSIDHSFNPRTLMSYAPIYSMAPGPDGSVFVAGGMDYLNGKYVGRVAKLKSDGTVDESFNVVTGPKQVVLSVQAIAAQSDGKVIAAGGFTNFGGEAHNAIVRLNADGTIDDTFKSPFTTQFVQITAVALQSTGKIIIGGIIAVNDNDVPHVFVKRLNVTGSIDNTFVAPDGTGDDVVTMILVLPDDKLMVAGNLADYNSDQTGNDLVRLNANGSFDSGFNAELPDSSDKFVREVRRLADGTMFVSLYKDKVLKIFADGSADGSFDPPIALDADYNVTFVDDGVVVGQTDGFQKYNVLGDQVAHFDLDYSDGKSLFSYGLNKVFVSWSDPGPITSYIAFNSDVTQNYEWTLTALGVSDDFTFNTGRGRKVIQQPDGKLVVRTNGQFYASGAGDLHRILPIFRLNADLSFDDTFVGRGLGGGDEDIFEPLFADSQGKIYVNQYVSSAYSLIRLKEDGTTDNDFTAIPGYFNDVAELPGGAFVGVTWNSTSQTSTIVRFNDSGVVGPAATYTPALYEQLMTIDVLSDGGWLITSYSEKNVLKFKPDGSFDHDFKDTGSAAGLEEAGVYDDQLFVAGRFATGANDVIIPLRKINLDGTSVDDKNNLVKNYEGTGLAIDQDNGNIFVNSKVPQHDGVQYELRRYKSDGTLDRRFLPVEYQRSPFTQFSKEDKVFLLNDKTLLIVSDTMYHVTLPGSEPDAASNAVLSLSASNVVVSWSDNSDNESVFEIEQSDDGGETYNIVGTVDANVTTFNDSRPVDGTYRYRVIAANAFGAGSPSNEESIDVVTTGLLEAELGFKAYPNPVKHQLQIKTGENVERFSLFQADGRLMETSNPRSNDFRINMSDYATGLYILQLESIEGKKAIKIFKQ